MVIQRCYENWSAACCDRVKTHSDSLNAPWNLFPAPAPYLWHSKMQTKIHCIVPEFLHTHTHSYALTPSSPFAPSLSGFRLLRFNI